MAKLTEKEIEKYSKDINQGFDTCSVCNGVELAMSMQQIDANAENFDLICDDCLKKEVIAGLKIAMEMLIFSFFYSERDGEAIASILNGIDRLDFIYRQKLNIEETEETLWFRLGGNPTLTDRNSLDKDLRGKFASKSTTAYKNYEFVIEQFENVIDLEQNYEVEVFFS